MGGHLAHGKPYCETEDSNPDRFGTSPMNLDWHPLVCEAMQYTLSYILSKRIPISEDMTETNPINPDWHPFVCEVIQYTVGYILSKRIPIQPIQIGIHLHVIKAIQYTMDYFLSKRIPIQT
jgi:hypothetical protein